MEQQPFNPNDLSNKSIISEKTRKKEGTLSLKIRDGVYEKYSVPKVTYAEDIKESPTQIMGVSLEEFQEIRSRLPEQQNLLLKYIYELGFHNEPEKLSDILECEVGELRNLTRLAKENFEKVKKESLNGDFFNDLGVFGFDEFAEKYYKTIFDASLRQLQKYNYKNSTSDASDIAQEIMIKLMDPNILRKYKKTEIEDKRKNAENWLRVITKNYTIDRLGKGSKDKSITNSLENEEGQEMPFSSKDQDPLEELITNENNLEEAQKVLLIEENINKLPKDLRDAINLLKNGFNYEQASRKLDIPEGTYKSRVSRAKELIRIQLARKGYEVGSKRAIKRRES